MKYIKLQELDDNEGQIGLKMNLNNKYVEEKEKNIVKINFTMKYILYIFIIMIIILLVFLFRQLKIISNQQNIVSIQQNIISNLTKIIESGKNETKEESEETYDEEETEDIQDIPKIDDVFKQESFSSRTVSFKNAQKFLENSMKGILLKEIPSKPILNPIVTVVIPVYNSKNYISRAMKSIQNQNIQNIEIILVNDYSKDNTSNVIKELQMKDKRIKIINNQKNKGILYSRCIGTLSAKGKYIFPLDNDDMFLDEDVFEEVTTVAEKGHFDIVKFKGIDSKDRGNNLLKNKLSDTVYSNHPLNFILFQPELGNYQIWPTETAKFFHIESILLWAKCIRTETYKKTINRFGEERYNRYIICYEDAMMNYALFNTARSYKFIGKYGIFRINRSNSASKGLSFVKSTICYINYLDVIIAFSQDRYANKKILFNLLMNLLSRKTLEKALNSSKNIKELFISCIDRVLKTKKIPNELKDKIRTKGKQL